MPEPIEEVVILGGGPAGLSAADACREVSPLLIEAGSELDQRDQQNPDTNSEGIGGAGLFSDGKFSFQPSATRLWQLDDRMLNPAWARVVELLGMIGVQAPLTANQTPALAVVGGHLEKTYPSVYASPEQRASLIRYLDSRVSRKRTNTRVVAFEPSEHGWDLSTQHDVVRARRVIVATGRFGPGLLTSASQPVPMRTLRLEVGVRLEQPTPTFFLQHNTQIDPKLIWKDPDGCTEWRTFCCCRDGLVVATRSQGMLTVSGRADCPASGRSNVGFNVRIVDPALIASTWIRLPGLLRDLEEPVRVGLPAFLAAPHATRLGWMLGEELTARLARGLARLLEDFSEGAMAKTTLIGPTMEGVGMYPEHSSSLESSARGLWVAGDIVGSFRGLTAALVSGQIAGRGIANDARGNG